MPPSGLLTSANLSTCPWLPVWDSQLCSTLQSLEKRRLSPTNVSSERVVSKRPRHPASNAARPGRVSTPKTPFVNDRRTPVHVHSVAVTEDDIHQREKDIRRVSIDVDREEFREFTNSLKKFVRKAGIGTKNAIDADESVLKATANISFMTELQQKILLNIEQGAICHVDPQLLRKVIFVLESRVKNSANECVVAVDSSDAAQSTAMDATLGIVAALIIIAILAAPESPRVLLLEDLLDNMIGLLRNVLSNVLYPMYDPLCISAKMKNTPNSGKLSGGSTRKPRLANDDNAYINKGSFRALRTSKRASSKLCDDVFDVCCSLFDSLAVLFLKEAHLPDSVISQSISICVQALPVTGIARLQFHVMKAMNAIFSSYGQHRLSILDEVREAAAVVPANRRHLRCFLLPGERNCIRVTSALIAQLLCISSTDAEDVGSRGRNSKQEKNDENSWFLLRRKRHDRAAKMAGHVFESLLNRSYTDREPEFRAAFQYLFEDILSLYGLPEWPSAELMLQTISVSVITKMRLGEDQSVFQKSFCIDLLGALAARMCDLYGIKLLKGAGDLSTLEDNIEQLEIARENLLLFLDPKKALHISGACSFLEAMFITDDQSVSLSLRDKSRQIALDQSRIQNPPNEEVLDGQDAACFTDKEIIAEVEMRALRRMERVSSQRLQGKEVDIKRCVESLRFIGMHRSFAGGFNTIIDAILKCMHDTAPTLRAKSIKALSVVDESCDNLLLSFPDVLHYIEASCRDISTLTRDAALDLLSRSLAMETNPKKGPVDQIIDSSERTQETNGIDLFGKVFGIVEKRLSDSSTSVRKRAISIMRSVLAKSLSFCDLSQGNMTKSISGREDVKIYELRVIQICVVIVARLDDPEASVRDAAERTLRLGLFELENSHEVKVNHSQSPTAASALAERMISVFGRLPCSIHTSFFSRVVHEDMIIKQKQLLSAIVGAAVDQFYEYEASLESANQSKDVTGRSVLDVQAMRALSFRRVACSSVLCAFSTLKASLIVPHCRALAPSIKGVRDGTASDTDIACALRILRILELGLGHSVDLEKSFLDEVLHDVETIMCQSPTVNLEEPSVRCLCVIAKKAGTQEASQILIHAANIFLDFLNSVRDELREYCRNPMPQRLSSLERNSRGALVRLGLLSRYGEFEADYVKMIYETLVSVCVVVCVENERDMLARASIRALTHLLIRHRSFLTMGTKVLLNVIGSFSTTVGAERGPGAFDDAIPGQPNAKFVEGVRLSVLQGFNELLRDEEERNKSRENGDTNMEGICSGDLPVGVSEGQGTSEGGDTIRAAKHTKPILAAEEDAEAGFLAVSAQAMMPTLMVAVHSQSAAIRRTVANILGLLTRQGLVLPSTIVASLFSFLLDPDPRCRDLALRVVSFLADRHSGMFASASVSALRMCFESSFVTRYSAHLVPGKGDVSCDDVNRSYMRGNNEGTDVSNATVQAIVDMSVDPKSGLSLLSEAVMAMKRDQRRGVFHSLIREFDPRVSAKATAVLENCNDDQVQEPDTSSVIVTSNRGMANENAEVQLLDDDDDVGMVPDLQMDISFSEKVSPLPVLCFLACTLATVDYTDGAGIGGCLIQGGGTAAADTKLKYAKEDVNELLGTMTRIISNSGQAILRIAKQMRKEQHPSLEKKEKIAYCAARLSWLLQLKHHLKFVRCTPQIKIDEVINEELDLTASACRMPEFLPDEKGLQLWSVKGRWSESEDAVELADKQLVTFETLMREDAIDESDVAPLSRKRSRALGRGRSSSRARKTKSGRAQARLETISKPPAMQLRRKSSQGAKKRLRFDGSSDDDEGSDFDPKGVV